MRKIKSTKWEMLYNCNTAPTEYYETFFPQYAQMKNEKIKGYGYNERNVASFNFKKFGSLMIQ